MHPETQSSTANGPSSFRMTLSRPQHLQQLRQHPPPPQGSSVTTGGRVSTLSNSLASEIPPSPPPPTSSAATTIATTTATTLAAHTDYRQAKAAVHVLLLFGITALLHWLEPYGEYLVWAYTFFAFVYLTRLFFYPLLSTSPPKPLASWKNLSSIELALRGPSTCSTTWPVVHILIPARKEAAVIANALDACLALDYPDTRYQIYAIHDNHHDDDDDDGTAEILEQYAARHAGMIRVLQTTTTTRKRQQHNKSNNNNNRRRQEDEEEEEDTFKAGALNTALPYLPHYGSSSSSSSSTENDDLILVLNADATLEPDALRQAVPYFLSLNDQDDDNNNQNNNNDIGAIQFRKQYVNGNYNSWTKSQVSENGFDYVLQLQRSAMAHTGELRGNGYMLRSRLLLVPNNNKYGSGSIGSGGGFATHTLTEDLDLTCQITCLQQHRVLNVATPVVIEEAVIGPIALWKQRCRWCHGGFQRHLEYYWPVLFSKTPGVLKWYQWLDVLLIGMIQYALPLISIMDMFFSIAMRRFLPMWFPFQCVVTLFGMMFMMKGIYQTFDKVSVCFLLTQTFFGLLFMGNWFLVVIYVTLRMAFCPMRHYWVKTEHGLWNRPREEVEVVDNDDDNKDAMVEVVLSKDESEMVGSSTASESGMVGSSITSTDSSRLAGRDEEESAFA